MDNRTLRLIQSNPCPKGFTKIFAYNPDTGVVSNMSMAKNAIMTDAAECMAHQATGDMRYRLSYIYMQFENLASPAGSPSVPTFTQDEGAEYFAGLEVSPNQDFMRVPIEILPTFSTKYSEYEGNIVTYVAMASESYGFWGKPFSNAANSSVFGGALVASPGSAQADDKVFARNYPAGANIIKPEGELVVVQWAVEYDTPGFVPST